MPKSLLMAALLVTSTAFAKTRDYDFEAPCDQVWAAVREVVMHSGRYGVLFISDKDLTASYNIGGSLGGRRTNTVQLKAKETGCTMSVQTAFSGLAHNDAGDFFTRVKEAVSKSPATKHSESEPSKSAGDKPSTDLTPQVATGATLEISSKPEGADIELDGKFVGNAPSSVGVAPGEHTIKLTKSGYTPWERKVKTTTGTVKISPELEAAAQRK